MVNLKYQYFVNSMTNSSYMFAFFDILKKNKIHPLRFCLSRREESQLTKMFKIQAANSAETSRNTRSEMQPKAKQPSEEKVNMANSLEKIPRNKMALRFAKSTWIKLLF